MKCVNCNQKIEKRQKKYCKSCSKKIKSAKSIQNQKYRYHNDETYRLKKIGNQLRYYENKAFGGLKQEVLKRDNYQCYICNMPTNLVHHINHNPSYNSMDNLKSICRSCHTRYHKWVKRMGISDHEVSLDTLNTFKFLYTTPIPAGVAVGLVASTPIYI